MRILLVTPSYFPIVGGSEVLTRILATKLNEQHAKADIMTFNMNNKWHPAWKEELSKDGAARVLKEGAFRLFPRVPNPMSNIFQANVIPNPASANKLKEYDLIHFVGEADLSFPIFSCFIKKPKILHCVGIFRNGGVVKYYTSDRRVLGAIFRKMFSGLGNCFIVTSSEEKKLLTNLDVPDKKIRIVPLGVETDVFRPDPSKKRSNLLLFVGRLDPIKGLHTLLQALKHIDTPLELVVIGPSWDLDYVKKIETMSYEINESGRHSVRLLGALDSKDLVAWYQRASILVCPYTYETHSNVVREALACGTPVVSTGSHLVADSPDGIILAKQNPRDLARVITKVITTPELSERLGREGRNTIEAGFSWHSIVRELIVLYEKILLSRK